MKCKEKYIIVKPYTLCFIFSESIAYIIETHNIIILGFYTVFRFGKPSDTIETQIASINIQYCVFFIFQLW